MSQLTFKLFHIYYVIIKNICSDKRWFVSGHVMIYMKIGVLLLYETNCQLISWAPRILMVSKTLIFLSGPCWHQCKHSHLLPLRPSLEIKEVCNLKWIAGNIFYTSGGYDSQNKEYNRGKMQQTFQCMHLQ